MPRKKADSAPLTDNENLFHFRIDKDLLPELDKRRGMLSGDLYLKGVAERHLASPDGFKEQMTRIEAALLGMEKTLTKDHDKLGGQMVAFFAEIFYQGAQFLQMHTPLPIKSEKDLLSRESALDHFGKLFEQYARKG